MKHIHIALVLFVCSFITLSCAKNTLVYRRYHRKRPSLRKTQKNVVEIVEVFKTNRRPPAFMKSDKSIEKFLLCDAKCEKKRFLKRRKMCLRTGRFCPTRPSGSKVHPTTQINVSTRPIYNKPTIYHTNPYNNRNPDYTHLYPWSRPSVTVTKYAPDGSKDFNMTIVEVNNDTVISPIKDDYEYYDTDNDDRYQRRSTTFRVPTTTSEWIPEISTIKVPDTPTTVVDTTTRAESTESIRSTLPTTSEATSQATDFPIIIITNQPEPENLFETTTEYLRPAPPTSSIYIDPSTTPTTTETPTTERQVPSTTEEITTEASTSTSTTTQATTSTTTTTQVPTSSSTTTQTSTSTTSTTEIPTSPGTTTQVSTSTTSTTEIPTSPSTTTQVSTSTTTTTQTSTSTTTEFTSSPIPTEPPTTVSLTPHTIQTAQNQTEATNTEQEEDAGPDDYGDDYEEGEAEEGTDEGGEVDNAQVDGENGDTTYDYDDDGNYDDNA